MRSPLNVSVDRLATSLDRVNINAHSTDKRMQFAQVVQSRFEAAREELQDRMWQLAQECPQLRLSAVGYAIRCADILLNSHLTVSNTAVRNVSTERGQPPRADSLESRSLFFESLTILKRHIRALNTKLEKVSATIPHFELIATSQSVSCSLMLRTLLPATRTENIKTEWTAAQLRAALTIEVHRSEAMAKDNVSFRRTCAVLVCGNIPIAKSISGRTDYAKSRAFRSDEEAGIRFLNQSYWHEQSLLLSKEINFHFHEPENFSASHAEIHLMTFLFRESRLNPLVHSTKISEIEKQVMIRSVAMIYVSQEPCVCCRSFREALQKTGLNITLLGAPNRQHERFPDSQRFEAVV
jgi:hypothetical protein